MARTPDHPEVFMFFYNQSRTRIKNLMIIRKDNSDLTLFSHMKQLVVMAAERIEKEMIQD